VRLHFTKANWERFETANKTTTIRTKILKAGIYDCYGGSRFKPVFLGKVKIADRTEGMMVRNLTDGDAVKDGFENNTELVMELARLNPKLEWDSDVYIHQVEKLKEVGEK